MERAALIGLVRLIMDGGEKTDEELDLLLEQLQKNVPYPTVADLIYYEDLSAEAIVDKALNYEPPKLGI